MEELVDKMETAALRKSGIEVLGNIPWGTHLCQFYETKEDLIDILVPYFAEGLRNNELCIWITSPPLEAEEASLALQKEVPELEKYIRKGQIEIVPYTVWYLFGGEFDLERVLQGWVDKERNALDRGFDGLRATGNTFWLERKLWDSFVEYEARINNVIKNYRMIAICTYAIEKCIGSDIIEVIRNHESTLLKKGESWYVVEDVAKRRLADKKFAESQRKLRISEESYLQLMRSLYEGVWAIDDEGRTTFANERLAEMLGYSVDEMLGKHLFTFMDEKSVEIAKENLERRRQGISEEHDFEFLRKDGARIYTRLGTSPIIDEDGNYSGALAAVLDITERKRMEEMLANSERRYRELFNSASDAIFISDFKDRFLEVNRIACERLGYSREELLRMTPMDIATPEYAPLVSERIEELRRSGHTIFETAHVRREGTKIPTEVSSRVIDYEGKPAILSIARDITERKLVEATLLESERRYRALFEDSPISLWEEDFSDVKKYIDSLRDSGIKDFRTYFKNHPEALVRCASLVKVVDVNKATLDMYQAEEKEEILSGLSHIFEQETYEEFKEELLSLIEGREMFECESINKTLSGESKHISLRLTVAPGYEETWSKVYVSILDITERKRAEEALRESENKYSALVESSTDVIVIIQDGLFKFINTAAKQLGYNPEELIGTNFLNYVTPGCLELALERYTDRMAGKEVPSIYEIEVFRKDGTTLPVELNAVRINFQGKPAEMAFARDITERKRMEEELRRYSEHLEELVEERTRKLRDAERMAAIGETAAMVGHDLRNPLQVIIGSIYLANGKLNSISSPEYTRQKYDIEEQLQTIEEQINYMNKIVSDLEDFTRPVEPELVETKLNQLIVDTLTNLAVPETVKTSIEIEEDFPPLMVDPVMMRRVISNLIINALQAMPEGGQLTITLSKNEDAVFINIQDTGVGISEEDLPKIFQPLFTTKPRGQGFGLSVCKRLVEAHNGSIIVKSQLGRGSIFRVKIPL